tara:strand:- start:2000 stop:2569 length:570 start_codon:yes stop_codon:yes gene_type:complete
MSKLIPAKPLLYNISLFGYIFLYIRQIIKPYLFPEYSIIYSNIFILNSIYIYETLIALLLKKSILYKWTIQNYLEHHLVSNLFMLNNSIFIDLENNFINMQKYCIYINSYEITAILQNMNISKKYIILLKFISLFNLFNLIYYEIVDSYIYYNSINNNTKYLSILGFIAALYHIFIIIPSTLKFIKKNI